MANTSEPKMLIIYEENPEHLNCYLIPANGKMADDVAKINGKLINASEMTLEENIIAERLSTWIGSGKKRREAEKLPLQDVNITRVVHTGFCM